MTDWLIHSYVTHVMRNIICMTQMYFKITIKTEMALVEISDRDEEPFLMNGQF